MWKCPICGFENPSVTVCPQCRYDPSSDYTRYPTAGRIPESVLRPMLVNPSECSSLKDAPDLQGTVLVTPEEAGSGNNTQANVGSNGDNVFVKESGNQTAPECGETHQETVLIDSYQASIGGRALQLYTPDGELRRLNIPKKCKDGDVVAHTKIHVVDISAPLAEDLTKMSRGELLLHVQKGAGIFAWIYYCIWGGILLCGSLGFLIRITICSSFYNDFELGIPIIIGVIGGAIIGAIYGIRRGRKSNKTRALAELRRRGI